MNRSDDRSARLRLCWLEHRLRGASATVNIDYLNEFFVLAYRLNYSAAADELHVSQPVLSRHIAALEKELGATLFERDSQNVSLTVAGKACLQDVNNILADYNSLVHHARQFGSSLLSRKVIIQTYVDNRYLSDILHAVASSPDIVESSVGIELKSLHQTDFFSDVRDHKVDMMLVLDVYEGRSEELEAVEISSEPLVAVVPRSSSLADKESMRIGDLEGQKVAIAGRLDNHGYAAYISRILIAAGVSANVVEHYYGTVNDQLNHIGKDEIYLDTFVTTHNTLPLVARDYKIICFEDDAMMAKSVAVYRKDNNNPWLGMVISQLKRLMNAETPE